MGESTQNLDKLKEYKSRLQLNIMKAFQISEYDAKHMIELLEQEDFLKLSAPEIDNKPVTMLMGDRHISNRKLGMTSHKLGNIRINTYLDWRALAGFICSSVGTFSGLESGHPLLFWSSVLASVITASYLTDIHLDENQTAIIMALQKYKKHGYYRTNEEECLAEANTILDMYGYAKMDKPDFSERISELISYGCIDKVEDIIKLKEKILVNLRECCQVIFRIV